MKLLTSPSLKALWWPLAAIIGFALAEWCINGPGRPIFLDWRYADLEGCLQLLIAYGVFMALAYIISIFVRRHAEGREARRLTRAWIDSGVILHVFIGPPALLGSAAYTLSCSWSWPYYSLAGLMLALACSEWVGAFSARGVVAFARKHRTCVTLQW